MKRFFYIFTIFSALLITAMSMSSCSVAALAADTAVVTQQYDDIYYTYTVDYQTIVVKGVPVYNEDGTLAYYSYRNIFYYPYFWENAWYFHPYRYVQPMGFVHRPIAGFRPEPRFRRPNDFVFNRHHPGQTEFRKPDMRPNSNHMRPHGNQPNIGMQPNNPNMQHPNAQRPNIQRPVNGNQQYNNIRTIPNRTSTSRVPNVSAPSRGGSIGGGMNRGGNAGGMTRGGNAGGMSHGRR